MAVQHHPVMSPKLKFEPLDRRDDRPYKTAFEQITKASTNTGLCGLMETRLWSPLSSGINDVIAEIHRTNISEKQSSRQII